MKKEKAVILTVMRDNELKAIKSHYKENKLTLPKKMREKKSKKLRLKLKEMKKEKAVILTVMREN